METLIDGPDDAPVTLVLAHGAGAPMDSEFLERIARGVAERGVRVVRFEFPYMQRRRAEGGRRPPDRAGVLVDTWRRRIEQFRAAGALVIGGKSMGGRIASLVADEASVDGLVCLGYPFHPVGKPERLRTSHLGGLRTPTLILQGSRDALGSRPEIEGYTLSDSIEVIYLEDGDHSFRPRVRSGHTADEHLEYAIECTVGFVDQAASRSRSSRLRQ